MGTRCCLQLEIGFHASISSGEPGEYMRAFLSCLMPQIAHIQVQTLVSVSYYFCSHMSYTFPCENRKDIELISLSNDGRTLLTVDVGECEKHATQASIEFCIEPIIVFIAHVCIFLLPFLCIAEGRALVINFHRRVVVHRFNFRERVRAACFSPDDSLLAVAVGRKVHVWEAPALVRSMAPFNLRRTLTGHFDVVTCMAWSPSGTYLASGSRDATVRIHAVGRLPGFVPVTLGGHRGEIVNVEFFGPKEIYSVSRDGGVLRWQWVQTADSGTMHEGRLVAIEEFAR